MEFKLSRGVSAKILLTSIVREGLLGQTLLGDRLCGI